MKSEWKNMIYCDNQFYPIGYTGADLVLDDSV